MLISTILDTRDDLLHLTKDHYGAFVAHCVNLPGFYGISIDVSKGEIRVDFSLPQGVLPVNLQDHFSALSKMDPFPCTCGCGAFIAVSPCFEQSEKFPRFNKEAELMILGGNMIGAIKIIREVFRDPNTGSFLGLKDAKDMVDAHRERLYSSGRMKRPTPILPPNAPF